MEKEKIWKQYIESLNFERTFEDLGDPPLEWFQEFKKSLQKLGYSEDIFTPSEANDFVFGKIYSFYTSDSFIEIISTGIQFFDYHLFFKISHFIEFAGPKHLKIIYDNDDIIVETENPLFLDNKDLINCTLEGECSDPILRKFLLGLKIDFPFSDKILDKYDKLFSESEKEHITPWKNAYKEFLSEDEDLWEHPIDNEYIVSNLSEIVFLPISLIKEKIIFPAAAKSKNFYEQYGLQEPLDIEYNKNFTLKLLPDKKIIMEVDPKIIGKSGFLFLEKVKIYQGFLPKLFYLGKSNQDNLKSIITILKIKVDN